MKRVIGSIVVLTIVAAGIKAQALTIIKATTGTSLTATASWDGGTIPGVNDVATWGDASGGTSLGGALTYGSSSSPSYQGIDIQKATAAITISTAGANPLTLGSSGITIASGGVDLTLANSRTFNATSALNIGSGRTLTLGLASGGVANTTTFGTGTTTTLSGAGTLTLASTATTGAHTLTGDGNLTIGTGATLINNFQTGSSSSGYSGTTTLDGGTIIISTSISCFGTGAINLNGGAMGSFSATGRVIGSNAVNIGGNVQIGGSSGGLGTGYVRFDGATNLGGATREINAIASGVNAGFGSGAIFAGVISNGGITMTGSGILTLTNDGNAFTGATTVNAGNLAISLGALANSSSVTLNGTSRLSLGIDGTTTINTLSGASGATIRTDFTISGTAVNRTLSVNQTTDGEYAGSFVTGGTRVITLIKTGAANLTLSGTGGYTGGTTVNNGRLTAGSDTAFGTGLITVNGGVLDVNGRTITNAVNVNAGGTLTNSGTVNGAVTASGAAATVNGTGTFGGLVTVSGGVLSPGASPGFQAYFSGLLLQGAATTEFELGGTTRASLFATGAAYYDAIDVIGDAFALSGTVKVDWFGGFEAAAGDSFQLFDWSGTTFQDFSAFDVGTGLVLPTFSNPTLGWNKDTFTTDGTVSVMVIPEPATVGLLGLCGALALLRRRLRNGD